MNKLDTILTFNKSFVENKEYEKYKTTKYPDKKIVILSCMDTRLTHLLPKALHLSNGDAKIIKNAGAVITHPFGSVMRSILVAIYELKAEEVFVIGHHSCGMKNANSEAIIEAMKSRGIDDKTINILNDSGININKWLTGFDNVIDSVKDTVNQIRKHPLMPKDVFIHGLIIHPETGALEVVEEGY